MLRRRIRRVSQKKRLPNSRLDAAAAHSPQEAAAAVAVVVEGAGGAAAAVVGVVEGAGGAAVIVVGVGAGVGGVAAAAAAAAAVAVVVVGVGGVAAAAAVVVANVPGGIAAVGTVISAEEATRVLGEVAVAVAVENATESDRVDRPVVIVARRQSVARALSARAKTQKPRTRPAPPRLKRSKRHLQGLTQANLI